MSEVQVEKSVGTTSPESARKSVKKYESNPANKAKLRQKWRIQSAKRSGKIKMPKKCQRCGREAKVDFHHNKGRSEGASLKGRWLCRKCHSTEDPKRHGAAMRNSMKKATPNK